MWTPDPDFNAAMQALEDRTDPMDDDMVSRVVESGEEGVRGLLEEHGLAFPEWHTRLMSATTRQLFSELRLRVFKAHLFAIEMRGDPSVAEFEGPVAQKLGRDLRRAGTYLKRVDSVLRRVMGALELVEAAGCTYERALRRRDVGMKRLQDRRSDDEP